MNCIDLHDVLEFVRWPAMSRLRQLLDRVKPVDLTPQEVMALLVVFESADQRVNASAAPVARLVPRDGWPNS